MIPQTDSAPPSPCLLLATDLSARCDRALDRAAQLAGEWRMALLALNVLDPATSPDQALAWASGSNSEALLRVARQQLARDLASIDIPASLRVVRSNDAAAAIGEAAATAGAALVVTGVSRNETFGRFLLGSTVEQLARVLAVPLLVVRNRVRGPYRRILVATDFSASSGHALRETVQRFPGRPLTLYHAHSLPLAGLTETVVHAGVCRAIEERECLAFLDAWEIPPEAPVRPVVECGAIETTLTRHVREQDIDLVVLGSRGASGVADLLLGSTAARMLDWLPCDTLLVPGPPLAAKRS